jgi:hypothetical protein
MCLANPKKIILEVKPPQVIKKRGGQREDIIKVLENPRHRERDNI